MSLLGSIAANNNASIVNPNVSANSVGPQLGGSIQGVVNLFQQRQVELESNFQALTMLLEAALQPNSGQQLHQQQTRQHQGIPQDPQQQQHQATLPAGGSTEQNGANDDMTKMNADNNNAPLTIGGSSKKKTTTPEAVSNGRVMGQTGDAIVPCRARGLARNHNTRVRKLI